MIFLESLYHKPDLHFPQIPVVASFYDCSSAMLRRPHSACRAVALPVPALEVLPTSVPWYLSQSSASVKMTFLSCLLFTKTVVINLKKERPVEGGATDSVAE